MPDIVTTLLDLPKQLSAAIKSPRTAFVLVFVSGGFLIASNRLPASDRTELQKYHLWFVGSFLFGTAILLISLFVHLYSVIQARFAIRKMMRTLLPDEKYVLLKYVHSQTCTQNLQLSSGVVTSLRGKGLISNVARVGRFNEFAMTISPYVYDYLCQHPEVLDGAQEPGLDPFEVGNPFRSSSH